jgi:AraC family transcriptional activator of pobA
MAKKVKNKKPLRFGLYGEKEVVVSDFVHIERMLYKNPKHNSFIPPHIHANLYQIFFIYQGAVRFYLTKEECNVKAPAAVVIPDNTMHGMKCDDRIDGMVLTFSSSFSENELAPSFNEEKHRVRILELTNPRTFERVKDIVSGLFEELYEAMPKKHVIHSYLYLLLNKTHQLSLDAREEFVSNDSRTHRLYRSFLKNVKHSYSVMKPVTEYAEELGITTVHLNRICSQSVNKSPLDIIHDFVLAESKQYLIHSEFSISEISNKLDFTDPAYFSRFFKKRESISPKVFRNISSI